MKMIFEIAKEDQNLNLSEANLFNIYDRFTRKMIKKCQDNGPEAKKDIANRISNSKIVDFFQQQAFLSCFMTGHAEIGLINKNMIDLQFNHVCRPPLDEIVRIGLMYASSSGKFHFIHQTFAEFFVAKFFYEEIFKLAKRRAKKYLNTTIEFLLNQVLENDEFIVILLEKALESDEKLTAKKFSSSTLKVVQEKMELEHFELLVRRGYYNLIKFIISHLHPDGQKLLFTKDSDNQNLIMVAVERQSVEFIKRFFSLPNNLNEFKKLFFERDDSDRNVLFFAASNPNSKVFKFIVEFCESFMTCDELNELLMQTGRLDKTILHSALKGDRNVDIIIEILTQKLSLHQQKTLLKELTDSMRYNLLQFTAKSKNSVANFDILFAFMRKVLDSENKENFLLHQDKNGFKAFDLALTSQNELVFDAIRNFYLEVFGEDKMPEIILNLNKCENLFEKIYLHVQQIYSHFKFSDEIFKRLFPSAMKLFAVESISKELFSIRAEDGKTFIKLAVIGFGEEDFDFFCLLLETNLETIDRVEVLCQKDSRGENAFHWVARRNNLDVLQKFRKLYEESFDKPNLRKMIVSCDKSWILDVVRIRDFENFETFTELCNCLKDLFKGTEEAEELKGFFLFADDSGQTAFMAAAENKKRNFEDLIALIKELYTVEIVKNFLLLKDSNGATAFNYSFISGLNDSFEFVKSVFEDLIEQEKMQGICLVQVQNENILFHSISSFVRLDSFEMFCNYLIKLFKDEAYKLKNTFVSVDSNDKTVLMKAAQKPRKNFFLVLVNVIEKVFVKEEVEEMLYQRNQEGKTAFHFSISNATKIYETARDFYIKSLGNEAMKIIILAKVDWTSVLHFSFLNIQIKRLVLLLRNLSLDVGFHLKNILLEPYEGRSIKEELKSNWKYTNASIVSYLKKQFQDDEQIKMLLIELKNNESDSSDSDSISSSDLISKSDSSSFSDSDS